MKILPCICLFYSAASTTTVAAHHNRTAAEDKALEQISKAIPPCAVEMPLLFYIYYYADKLHLVTMLHRVRPDFWLHIDGHGVHMYKRAACERTCWLSGSELHRYRGSG